MSRVNVGGGCGGWGGCHVNSLCVEDEGKDGSFSVIKDVAVGRRAALASQQDSATQPAAVHALDIQAEAAGGRWVHQCVRQPQPILRLIQSN